jgi:glycosyltransferase 2 family protein
VSQGPSKTGILLKLLFGGCVLAWMASTGKLNLAQVGKSLSEWPVMLTIAALGYAQIGITAWRWRLLLRAQEIRLSASRAWGLTMIGMLFNVVVPGAVGGDLIKGYYITRAAAGRKSHAATSILVDRAVGLVGLLFLGAVMAAANLDVTLRSPATRSLGLLAAGGMVGGLASLYAAVAAGGRVGEWRWLPGIVRTVFRALHEYHRQSSVIPIALVLSVLNQGLTCGMYYLALRASGVVDLPAGEFFLIVPLGLVTSAIPISPAGVGVGQAAFFALFHIVAPAYAAAGTNALTAFQVMFILVCLSGLYWYISYKHETVETGAPREAAPAQVSPAGPR